MNIPKVAERAYYSLGLAYYLYHWITALGLTTIIVPIVFSAGPVWIGVGGTTGSLALIAAGILTWRKHRLRRACLNSQIDIERQVDTYDVPENGGAYVFTKDMTVKARVNGVQYYQCKHRWSGVGDLKVEVSPPEVALLADRLPTEDIYELVVVRFPRVLRKGEKQTFKITMTLIPKATQPQPYLAKLVDDFYPNGFRMCVNLPKVPRRTSREILRSRNFNDPTKTWPNADIARGIGWQVKFPRFDTRYKISWSLDDIAL